LGVIPRTPGPRCPDWPAWLSEWLEAPRDEAYGRRVFAQQSPLSVAEMGGLWQGWTLHSGHPLDGVLENLGWYGKLFHSNGRADPLLFTAGGRRPVAIDPVRIPLKLALRFADFGRTAVARSLFSCMQQLLLARGPTAELKELSYNGVKSAAMTYDRQPIIDYFHQVDHSTILGLMQIQGDQRPYFFVLSRPAEGGRSGRRGMHPKLSWGHCSVSAHGSESN